MTTQEYVDYVSQFNERISNEVLIELLIKVIKTKMRLSKKNNRKFCFFWFTIHYRSTRK